MNSRKMSFLIPLLFLALIPSATASKELASGSLGYLLYYVIESPTELKVGEEVPINFWFQNGGTMPVFVKDIWISTYGADINSSETGISKLLANDVELSTFESVNETILVKPLEEGTVVYMVSAEYNWTDPYGNQRYEWGNDKILVDAKADTYGELLVSISIFKNIAYILSASTIAFIAATAYLLRRLGLKRA